MRLLRHRPADEYDLGHLQRTLDALRLEASGMAHHIRELEVDCDRLHGENRRLAGEVANLTAERDELRTMLHGRTA